MLVSAKIPFMHVIRFLQLFNSVSSVGLLESDFRRRKEYNIFTLIKDDPVIYIGNTKIHNPNVVLSGGLT